MDITEAKDSGQSGVVVTELVKETEPHSRPSTSSVKTPRDSLLTTISATKVNHQNQLILTQGLTSKMRDEHGQMIKDKVFVRHWRPFFYMVYIVITSFFDGFYNTYWVFSLLVLLSHVAIIVIVSCIPHFRDIEIVPSISHEFRDHQIYHSIDKTNKENNESSVRYESGMSWFLGLENNWKLLDCRWLWVGPGFGCYISFIQMIVNIVWGTHPSMKGCDEISREQIADGSCFIVHEWGFCFSAMALTGFAVGNLCFYDITPYTMNKIIAMKHEISKLMPTDHYFDCLKNARDYSSKFELKKTKIFVWFLIGIVSLHLLFWQMGSSYNALHRIEDNLIVVICLYIFMVPMWMLLFYFLWLSVITIYLPFRDLSLIMTVFSYPLVIQKEEDIKIWWVLRNFYLNYVMPIYFRFGDSLFFSYCVATALVLLLLVLWSFGGRIDVSNMDYVTVLCCVVGIVMTALLLAIAITIASIHSRQLQHLKMLKQEKLRLICKQKDKDVIVNVSSSTLFYNDWRFIQIIENVIKLINDHDAQPRIMGIKVNNQKIYLFLAYAVSAIVTFVIKSDLLGL